MQTFLPYPSYELSAKALDYKRLNKQVLEARMIYRIIVGLEKDSRWRNHPAVRMWKRYPYALSLYFNAMLKEWKRRGYKSRYKSINHPPPKTGKCWSRPPWLFEPRDLFCSIHRAALLKKNPSYYSNLEIDGQKMKWKENPRIDYWWPVIPLRHEVKIVRTKFPRRKKTKNAEILVFKK